MTITNNKFKNLSSDKLIEINNQNEYFKKE